MLRSVVNLFWLKFWKIVSSSSQLEIIPSEFSLEEAGRLTGKDVRRSNSVHIVAERSIN